MKLTLRIQLLPTTEQATALRDVMTACNAAATHAAWVGFQAGAFTQPSIHKLCYAELREAYGLSAQLAVRAIGKAVEVFRRDKTRAPVFRRHENHCISKQIVSLAEGTKRGIAVEDLGHIRARTRFAKAQRARMGGWAFAQLQQFLGYKAQRAGVPFVKVDARYTSQTCHACGHCERANRPDQSSFVCTACNHVANADVNAAQNIAARGVCNAPKGV